MSSLVGRRVGGILRTTGGGRHERGDRAGRLRGQEGAIKRAELPTDLAGAFVYLAANDSAFVTGQTLIVDGGRVCW
jgi:NAD(P)-dependent dehydrogenase (short-subunit alcohol dehydrogenase family)